MRRHSSTFAEGDIWHVLAARQMSYNAAVYIDYSCDRDTDWCSLCAAEEKHDQGCMVCFDICRGVAGLV